MKRRRWAVRLAVLLACSLLMSLMPAVASASENVVTVTLQKQSGQNSIYYGNVQSSFPNAGWTDPNNRIYIRIPAGQYDFVHIGGLPDRRGKSPVTITNAGGQVKIGQPDLPKSQRHYYAFSLSGGANWIVTGEYDAGNSTGDAGFTGHQNGNYANSSGSYGIEVRYTADSGVKIGGGATDFELSFMEVAHTGFAGLLIKNDNQPTQTMANVSLHDLYVHDTEGEGMYIGNTNEIAANQHKFVNLQVYNNRIVRSGTEGLQISHMGDGSRVHNNVILMSAQGWKSPFQKSQDFGVQIMARYGDMEFDHNIVIGAASNLFNIRFIGTAEERQGAPGQMDMHDNFFSHSRGALSYLFEPRGGSSNNNLDSAFLFRNNLSEHLDFQLSEVRTASDANRFHDINGNAVNPFVFTDNRFEGSQQYIAGLSGPNGTTSHITASGNQQATIQPVQFMDDTFPASFDYLRVEQWFPELLSTNALVQQDYNHDIYYETGDYVVYNGHMYECLADHNGKNYTPGSSPSVWQEVPMMTDDLRLDPSSPHQGMGLLDTPNGGGDGNGDGDGDGDGDGGDDPVKQLIEPADADTALGSQYFPMYNAFEGTVTYDAATGELAGGSGGNFAPYYQDRYGYIDFGPNWADVRIAETWTKYRQSSVGNQTPYTQLWWDDDKDITNDSGLGETSINFNTAQGLNTGSEEPWLKDSDLNANPVAPKARYLILHSPADMKQRALEYAIIGWIEN